jgi:hypothetical protein
MSSPSSLPSRFEPSSSARSAVADGSLVLLDVDRGDYLSFNAVAAAVWQRLSAGGSLDRVVASLAREYGVPPERVEKDVYALVGDLTARGLLQPSSSNRDPVHAAAAPAAETRIAASRGLGSWTGVARAWLILLWADLVMRLGGFRRLVGFVSRAGRGVGDPPAEEIAAELSRSVDGAAALYYRKAWCLQRSAACAWLLRRRGFPARLVLGVRPMPFFAHAWVELNGRLVNEEPGRVRALIVLDRFG